MSVSTDNGRQPAQAARLLSIRDAASELGVSAWTLRDLIGSGKFARSSRQECAAFGSIGRTSTGLSRRGNRDQRGQNGDSGEIVRGKSTAHAIRNRSVGAPHMLTPLSKESAEVRDDRRDGGLHLAEEREHRKAIAHTTGFTENYVRGQVIHVHAKWWLWERPSDVQHLCARFHWLFSSSEWRDGSTLVDMAAEAECLIEDQDNAVLIDVVELGENVEGITGRARGVSLVWLRALDCCELILSDQRRQNTIRFGPILRSARKSLASLKSGKRIFSFTQMAGSCLRATSVYTR